MAYSNCADSVALSKLTGESSQDVACARMRLVLQKHDWIRIRWVMISDCSFEGGDRTCGCVSDGIAMSLQVQRTRHHFT